MGGRAGVQLCVWKALAWLFVELLEAGLERPKCGNPWAVVLAELESPVLWCEGAAPHLHVAFLVRALVVLAQGASPCWGASPVPLLVVGLAVLVMLTETCAGQASTRLPLLPAPFVLAVCWERDGEAEGETLQRGD